MTDVRVGVDAYRPNGPGVRTSTLRKTISVVMTPWRQHKDLLANASSLIAANIVSAALGFSYWAIAARLFSQRSIGYGSAVISAMTVLGTIGMFGLNTVLIGELPRRPPGRSRAGLVSAALLAASIGSLLLGLGFSIVAPHVNMRFAYMFGSPGRAAIFSAGVLLTGVTMVFDQATIGLLRGGLQLSRNLAFSIIKMVALPGAAIILHDGFGAGITLSWVAGMALSMLPIAIRLRITGTSILPRPDWAVLRSLRRAALAHNWLNLAIQVPWLLLPVLVTIVVSPSANAAFYVAWMLTNFLYIVPANLSTVLFAIAAAEPQAVARKLRFTLRLSFLIGLPGMAILGLGAHQVLRLFGPEYARTATLALWLLVIGYLPAVPRAQYIAVCRAKGKVPRAAAVLTTTAVIKVTAAAVGGASGGLKGLSFALLGASLFEGLVTTPSVLHAALGKGRHRPALGKGRHRRREDSAKMVTASKWIRRRRGGIITKPLVKPDASTISAHTRPNAARGEARNIVSSTPGLRH